jgi:hypothetical protein
VVRAGGTDADEVVLLEKMLKIAKAGWHPYDIPKLPP